VDGHLGASRNSEEAREPVDDGRGCQDLGAEVGELLDHDGSGVQISLHFGLVAEEDGISAVPEAVGKSG